MEVKSIRRPWDAEEDEILRATVIKIGDNWRKKMKEVTTEYNKEVKEKFGDGAVERSESQLRSHWYYLAKRNLDNIEWTEENDQKLIEAYYKYKDSYPNIAQDLGGTLSTKDIQKRLKVIKDKMMLNPEMYKYMRSSNSTAQPSRAPSPPTESTNKKSKERLDDIYEAVENIDTKVDNLQAEFENQTEDIAEMKAMMEEIHAFIKQNTKKSKPKKED